MVEDYYNTNDKSKFKIIMVTVRHKMKTKTDPFVNMEDDIRSKINDTQRMLFRLKDHMITRTSYDDNITPALRGSLIAFSKHFEEDVPPNLIDDTMRMIADGLDEHPWSFNLVRTIHTELTGVHDIRLTNPHMFMEERIFDPCPPENIKNEMRFILEWAMQSPYDPFIKSAIFLHEYLSIRPFIDDWGMTGLVLTYILLKRNGIDEITSCAFMKKMTEVIEPFTVLFLETERSGDYTRWVESFVDSMHDSASELERTYGSEDILRNEDIRTRTLARSAREHGQFTISEASSWTDIGEQTVRSKLERLVELGILEKQGKTKGLKYMYIGC